MALCVIQMALALLVLTTSPPCRLVVSLIRSIAQDDDSCYYYQPPHPGNLSRANDGIDPNIRHMQIVFHTYHLEACVFIASVFATSFAALYAHLDQRVECAHDASETLAVLITWAFSATQFTATLGLMQEGAVISRDMFLLQLFTHVFGLIVACGTPPHTPMWTLAIMALPICQLTFAMIHACTQGSLVLMVMQSFMDILLFIGHRWDVKPTLECLQNCRLVYITGCCYILQMAVVVLPRLDSVAT